MPAELPANEVDRTQFVRTLPALRDYSVTEKIQRVQFSSPWRKTCSSNTDCIAGVTAIFTGRRTIRKSRERFARPTDAKPSAPECDE
jgi:hypothetical protein